ncbi:MAG: 4Fe-4S dicluster domain-containing protein, partial [Candidatus Hydrogenedentes bacterium]|nr:4Fe-4S dicluster domain-containing protein [Candidatus Hydrogenedentota bacterium]
SVVYNEMPYPACRRLVDPSSVSEFKPMPYLPVIRDMVVDTSRITDRLKTLRPYVEQLGKPQVPYTVAQDVIEPFREFRKCIECWSCISACPAIMEASQDFAGPTLMRQLARLELDPRDGLDRVSMALKEGLYKCTACGNCRVVCDKNIEMLGKAIERLRSLAVARELGPLPEHKPLTASIRNYWNPWQNPRAARARWAKKLDLPDKGETMFFAGCSPSLLLDDMSKSVVKLYDAIDEPLAYLGKKEHCCGSPLMRIGELDLFREMSEANMKEFAEAGAVRVVATCAGCMKTIKNDYPDFLGETGIEVVHVIEVAAEAIRDGRIKVKPLDTDGAVTYHDPCHLGREGGVFEAQRVVMEA